MNSTTDSLSRCDLTLERDGFLRDLLRHLSGTLQDVVGLDEAEGFISVVGQKMGENLGNEYRSALKVSNLNKEQVAATLVDLKQRIQGDFHIISQDDDKIILQGKSCPFGDKVIGRPSLCMMTTNVFGTIAAENLGYAKIVLEETIAKGASSCQVAVYLSDNDELGREFFKS